jgi:RimJ/RimL family protein N-acetyltransferase
MLPTEITTPRLRLRPPRTSDAAVIFERYAADPRVTRFLTWPTATSVETVDAFVAGCVEAWQNDPPRRRMWAITLLEDDDDRPIGMIEAHLGENGFSASIGYVLACDWWGHGYMTEAGRAVVAALFDVPAIYRVWAFCDVDNSASAHVLEKLGLVLEGRLHRYVVHPNISPEPRDAFAFARFR